MILHIPHSSIEIPASERKSIVLSDEELNTEILLMTDWFTDELFILDDLLNTKSLIFSVSRLIVDPERFSDDSKELMVSRGMGVIYTKTSSGNRLRKHPSEDDRNVMLNNYYHPHHLKLSNMVSQELNENGKAIIIDCHSFPSVPLPYELDQNNNRPDICIGTDAFHTPEVLVKELKEEIGLRGFKVGLNNPFSGSIVPMEFYNKDKRVVSIMIEVNRSLYMNERTGERIAGYDNVRNAIVAFCGVINKII